MEKELEDLKTILDDLDRRVKKTIESLVKAHARLGIHTPPEARWLVNWSIDELAKVNRKLDNAINIANYLLRRAKAKKWEDEDESIFDLDSWLERLK